MKKPYKVLFIQASPGGGSMVALFELLRQISPYIETVVLCYYKTNAALQLETIPGIRVLYLNNTYKTEEVSERFDHNRLLSYAYNQYGVVKNHFGKYSRNANTIYNIITKEKPVLVHHNNDIVQNRDAVRAASKAGTKQIVHNRSLSIYKTNYIDYLIDYSLSKKIDWYINISNSVQLHYQNLFHIKESTTSVVNDIINTNIFKPGICKASLKNELNIAETDYVIANIGRIIPWKGQHILIEAVALVKDKLSNVKIIIAGSYENGIGSTKYYNYLQSLVDKYNLQDIIFFVGNRINVAEVINCSDVVVHTAIKPEPQGLVIIEALLCGKPVVASDAGGASELVKQYGGLLVMPNDIEELASLLIKLVHNKTKNAFDLGYPLNYKKLTEDFDHNKQIAAILDVYKKVSGVDAAVKLNVQVSDTTGDATKNKCR